jgi:hypothetical protein
MLLLIIILGRTAEEDERSINHMGMAWQGNPGSEERRSLALSVSLLKLSVSAAADGGVLCLVLCVQLAKKYRCDDDDSVCHYLCIPSSSSLRKQLPCPAIIIAGAEGAAAAAVSLNLPGRVPELSSEYADGNRIMPSII